jgi:hypothetical protein
LCVLQLAPRRWLRALKVKARQPVAVAADGARPGLEYGNLYYCFPSGVFLAMVALVLYIANFTAEGVTHEIAMALHIVRSRPPQPGLFRHVWAVCVELFGTLCGFGCAGGS